MKKLFVYTLTFAAISLLGLSLFAQEQADAPKFKEGDFWHVKYSEQLVASSSRGLSGGIYELKFSGGKIQVAKVDEAQTSPIDSGDAEIGPLLAMLGRGNYQGGQYLKFPLGVGEKWSFEYRLRPRGAKKEVLVSAAATVTGSEDVTTPAGTFRAFKIVRQNTVGSSSTFTYYYSPETKSIVKMLFDFEKTGTRSVELVKFGSGQ